MLAAGFYTFLCSLGNKHEEHEHTTNINTTCRQVFMSHGRKQNLWRDRHEKLFQLKLQKSLKSWVKCSCQLRGGIDCLMKNKTRVFVCQSSADLRSVFRTPVAEAGHQHHEGQEAVKGEDEEVHPEEEMAGKPQYKKYSQYYKYCLIIHTHKV